MRNSSSIPKPKPQLFIVFLFKKQIFNKFLGETKEKFYNANKVAKNQEIIDLSQNFILLNPTFIM